MAENIWLRLKEIFNPTTLDQSKAKELLIEWSKKGFLIRTSKELLEIPDSTIVAFYLLLSEHHSFVSPHLGENDSGWFCRNDITFYNIRATGLDGETGNFVQASKLLLSERAHAIHLAPFMRYDHNTIYSIVAAYSTAPELWHPILVQAGIQPVDQVRLFVQACHLLGKAVGFDLEPHTAQFSYLALENPEAFRWIKVYTPDPRYLDYYYTPETVYKPGNQRRIVSEVRLFVRELMSHDGIKTFEEEPGDSYNRLKTKHSCFQHAVQFLIRNGYWTVPTHAWCSFGLPHYKGYNREQNYAEFTYHDKNGLDVSAQAYHILTPFCFWNGLPPSNIWNWEDIARQGSPNLAGIKLYQDIFLFWRDAVGFDFVRFDSVDHIWDSCDPHNPSIPFSDRPTPTILRDCILKIRTHRPDIATLAERLGDEIRAYETLGFDAILGSSVMENPGATMFEHDLKIDQELADLNSKRTFPFSVCAALDTHDTGNPLFRGTTLIELEGADGLMLRLFLARFLSSGAAYRPLYSVMGLTDLSYGLFQANIAPVSLHWTGNHDFLQDFHRLEDLYAELKPRMALMDRIILDLSLDGATWMFQGLNLEVCCKVGFPGGRGYTSPSHTWGWRGYCRQPGSTLQEGQLDQLPEKAFELSWRAV